jgi:polar amino acid transport system substrate-binding protein
MNVKSMVWTLVFALTCNVAVAQDALIVGITTTGIPFTFLDTTTQKPTGAMVDLATAIAADMGATPEFVVTQYSALIPSLKTGKIDLSSAAMFVTDKRSEVVSFSDAVYSYGETMFVAIGDTGQYQLADLEGETIGAQIGTTFAEELRQKAIFKEVKFYDGLVDIMRDVKLGRIRAGFGDLPIVNYQILKNPNLGIRIVEGYVPMDVGQVALAVAKDNPELLQKVNSAVARLKASGELKAIFAKYGL